MALRYDQAKFEASYGKAADIPEATMPEVSFAGRSNVGKSSLLNKLVGRKALAKVSSTPGRTANINFFEVDGIYLVDLPGYGFAKVSKAEQKRWANLIADYFDQERSFNLVVALVDIRHDAQKLDVQMLNFLQDSELPFVVALTKADKLSRNKQEQSPGQAVWPLARSGYRDLGANRPGHRRAQAPHRGRLPVAAHSMRVGPTRA